MSTIQRFFLSILPASVGKAMEKESRLWMIRCRKCGGEISYWDGGGIRYIAIGRPWKWRKCGQCAKRSWHETYKKD